LVLADSSELVINTEVMLHVGEWLFQPGTLNERVRFSLSFTPKENDALLAEVRSARQRSILRDDRRPWRALLRDLADPRVLLRFQLRR